MKRVFCKSICMFFLVSSALALCLLIIPFISFGKSLNTVVCDAAKSYGIEEQEYSVEFSNNLTNSKGESVYGLHTYKTVKGKTTYIIKIRNSVSRSIVVATIFHEFAHAAQTKYKLEQNGLTKEQHAEVLSFSVMRANGYWWESFHLITLHMFAKPAEYQASKRLWNIAITGAGALSVNLSTQS